MRCIKGFIKGVACALGLVVVLMAGFVLADGVCEEAAGCGSSIFGGGGSGTAGWPGSSIIKIVTWANSLANALRIGDGVTDMCFYTDATLGPTIRPCTASNILTVILNGFTWSLWDEEGQKAMAIADPDSIGAGSGTLTMQTSEQLVASNLGVELTESDTNPTCAAGNYNLYADTSETAIKMCRNGVAVQIPTSGLVRKTGNDAIQSDVSPNNDDELFFAVEASSAYVFKAFIMYSSATDADFRIDFAVPAGTTGQRLDRYPTTAITSCQGSNNGQHNSIAIDGENGNFGAGGVASTCIGIIEGSFLTDVTAGNVVFMWAQSVTQITDTTVYAGSYIEWRKL